MRQGVLKNDYVVAVSVSSGGESFCVCLTREGFRLGLRIYAVCAQNI